MCQLLRLFNQRVRASKGAATTSTMGPLQKSIGNMSDLMGGSVEDIWGLYRDILGLGEYHSLWGLKWKRAWNMKWKLGVCRAV